MPNTFPATIKVRPSPGASGYVIEGAQRGVPRTLRREYLLHKSAGTIILAFTFTVYIAARFHDTSKVGRPHPVGDVAAFKKARKFRVAVSIKNVSNQGNLLNRGFVGFC